MDLETKQISPTVKFDDDTGQVSAVFATLNVVDKDGDVTLPGFFGVQDVALAWAHDRSRLVGKGRISESGDHAVMNGKFFLNTYEGEQAYLTTKAMGDLQEWSYGFYIAKGGAEHGTHNGQSVRFLQPLDDGQPGAKIAEVSPVLVGAGEGTHTVGIKSEKLRFVEHAEKIANETELLVARAGEIHNLRTEKGKQLGDEAVASLLNVKTRLEHAASMIGDLASPPIDASLPTLSMMSASKTLAESRTLIGAS